MYKIKLKKTIKNQHFHKLDIVYVLKNNKINQKPFVSLYYSLKEIIQNYLMPKFFTQYKGSELIIQWPFCKLDLLN